MGEKTKPGRWITKLIAPIRAGESDLPYVIRSKVYKILYTPHYAKCHINSFLTIMLIWCREQQPHLPNNPIEASTLRNMLKITELLSGREPRVLTLKPILFTHCYTTYYHSIDERTLGSRLSFIPWANHLTLLSSVSSVNEGNVSCPTFSTVPEWC